VNKIALRRTWFQVHKWLGLVLGLLIIPLSLSGSALVWDGWLDETLHPARHAASLGTPALPAAAYAEAALRGAAPGERISSLRYPEREGAIVAILSGEPKSRAGRPPRTQVWLDPASAREIERADADAGILRVLHVLHGSLMVPGFGRQIVGWIGVAMLISSLTGLWLWWPPTGSFGRGLRWRRQNSTNANIHHQTGFWIAIPLAMLSFTGAWISFPAFFANISGDKAPGGADKARAARARPLAEPVLGADAALGAARPLATGNLVTITWPTDRAPEWKITFSREGGNAEVEVDDASGRAEPSGPPRPETVARKMRRWHDGNGMGPIWQIIIFLGGTAPAVLAVTGSMMWLRSRGWRARLKERRNRPARA